jgi:hypothetical protein
MRFDKTERLGVIETDRIVTKNIGWIFREQTIADVGIDAIIEQSEEGIPTGRFVAVQIKTGKGNFHFSEKKIALYVSHIHYNYWLNMNIPIILIAHLPETEKTYWQHICESNFKKTNKKWKIEIPVNQEFNEKSKASLIKILSDKDTKAFVFELYKGVVESDNLYDIVEKIECLTESKESINKIIKFIEELGERANNFNIKLRKYKDDGLTIDHYQVKASIKGYGRELNIISKRLENEIELYSRLFAEGFYAWEQVVLLHYQSTNDSINLQTALKAIEKLPESIGIALDGVASLKEGISSLPNKYPILKEAKVHLLEVFDVLYVEFDEARKMADNMKLKISNDAQK